MKNAEGYGYTMVIKGKVKDIMNILDEMDWDIYIQKEVPLENGITTMRIELFDEYINTASLDLAKHSNLKYMILVHPEDQYTDVIVFKDFGSSEHIINNAYTSRCGSISSEELEGTIFFPDAEFKIDYVDYSSGKTKTLKYNFTLKALWEDDSNFVNDEN